MSGGETVLSARMILRLIFASLLSGAAAGLLLALSIETLSLLQSLRPGGEPAVREISFLDWMEIGLILGLFAAPPAFFAGSAMWVLAIARPGARRPALWAAVGAAIGAGVSGLVELIDGPPRGATTDTIDVGFLTASLVCGAGAALAFRLVMQLSLGPPNDLSGRS